MKNGADGYTDTIIEDKKEEDQDDIVVNENYKKK